MTTFTTAIGTATISFLTTESTTTKESTMTQPVDEELVQLRKQQEVLDRTIRFYEEMDLTEPRFNVDQQPYLMMCEWYSRTGQRTTGHVQGFKNRSAQTVVWTAYENRGGIFGEYSTWMELVKAFLFRPDRKDQGLIVYGIDKLAEMHRFAPIDGTEVQFPEDTPKDLKVAARAAKLKAVGPFEVVKR